MKRIKATALIRLGQRKKREIAELIAPLKAAIDRDWKDETPEQVITIVCNALLWRAREIDVLSKSLAEQHKEQDNA